MRFHASRLFTLALALAIALPASAQTQSQLKQENERLKAELQALQTQYQSPELPGASWQGQSLDARIDTIRVGINHSNATITTTLTLRNTGSTPLLLNYKWKSSVLVDSNGYRYEGDRYTGDGTVHGIGITYGNTADTNSMLAPGGARKVTFTHKRRIQNGQTIGPAFDINATFVQLEDLGQGRIRKVRDYPVAFTNVAASSRRLSSKSPANRASDRISDATTRLVEGLIK